MFNFLRLNKNAKLHEALAASAHLIDVRSPGEFHSGSVPGAINIPVDQIERNIPKLAKLAQSSPLVLFCRSGGRAGMAQSVLAAHAITNVINGGSIEEIKAALR